MTDPPELVGRERELGLLGAQLDAMRASDGSAVFFSGEPGSGKTALLTAAERRAHGCAVIGCRGVEWEAELPFSGLHELVRPLLHLLPALPDPQRDALSGALGLTQTADVPVLHLYAGALSLLIEASADRPLLVIADDLQWIDSGTTQVLSFIARRLAGERLGLLLATRPGTVLPGLPDPVQHLEPLDRVSIAELAARHLGRPLPDDAIADLTAASGGNPLAVVESVAHVGDGLWFRGSGLDEPLPVGDLIERGF
ncbi:MAG: ATP-binding protein, partial [Solirubrobacteraceae bacterium]|nr:ATP-binding protein [Solirubrobacteraceae bacterium]